MALLPQLKHPDFLRMLGALDVCLDLWPFGGGFTTYEALVLAATPVVTLPSGVRSGRLTLATLRRLGLHAPVRVCVCIWCWLWVVVLCVRQSVSGGAGAARGSRREWR